jgi:hypothetical protein
MDEMNDRTWGQTVAAGLDIVITIAILTGSFAWVIWPAIMPLVLGVWSGLVGLRLVIRFTAWE